jgi:hypothetical protein
MLLVFLERPREDEDVQVGETEIETPQNVVHEALERLGGFAQTEEHEGELEYAEWSGNGHLLYIVGMDGDLIVCSHQVDFAEDGTSEKLVGLIMDDGQGGGRGWSVY